MLLSCYDTYLTLCPHAVGRISAHRGRGGGGTVTFTSPPLRHPQPFLAPKTLNFLVIDDPTLAAGVMVCRPKPAARMILGVVTQPPPQRSIRILKGVGDGLVSLSSAVLPGHAASEPFADPQHTLEVTNGRPPAFRA